MPEKKHGVVFEKYTEKVEEMLEHNIPDVIYRGWITPKNIPSVMAWRQGKYSQRIWPCHHAIVFPVLLHFFFILLAELRIITDILDPYI